MCASTTSRVEEKETRESHSSAPNAAVREPRTKLTRHKENLLQGFRNRILQHLARIVPGAQSLRVALHRLRGVHIGKNVWIGYDVILDTSRPYLIIIEDGASISMRVTVIAHFRETQGVKIEQDAFIGPGAIILPNVTIGHGAVVTAGSVVTQSVPPMTVVQGNPAVPIASVGIPLSSEEVSLKEFSRRLKPLPKKVNGEKL
jgi:acetyltransferase-like isoleucine patch superfamily enzyme